MWQWVACFEILQPMSLTLAWSHSAVQQLCTTVPCRGSLMLMDRARYGLYGLGMTCKCLVRWM